jgi:hypothetical protein
LSIIQGNVISSGGVSCQTGPNPLDVTYIGYVEDITNRATDYTFNSVDYSLVNTENTIVLAVYLQEMVGISGPLVSVTVNGTEATFVDYITRVSDLTAIYTITGITGTVDIIVTPTTGNDFNRCAIASWKISGGPVKVSNSYTSTAGSSASLYTTADIYANEVLIAAVHSNQGGYDYTWTTAIEDYDVNLESGGSGVTGASLTYSSTDRLSQTVGITQSLYTNDHEIVVVTFVENYVPCAADLTDGLVAHYLLNNNADDVYGTYDGTPYNGVDFTGDTASFDGVDDYINTFFTQTATSFTYSSWVYFNDINNDYAIVNSYNNTYPSSFTNIWYDLSATPTGHTNVISAMVGTGVDASTSTWSESPSSVISANQWYHISMVYDRGVSLKIYIDGVDNTEYQQYSTQTTSISAASTTLIGCENVSNKLMNGSISNVRLYNRALSQEEITALYEEGYHPRGTDVQASEADGTTLRGLTPPTTDGLVAYYPLTGTAEDATGNYADGTEGSLTYVDDVSRGACIYSNGYPNYYSVPNQLQSSFSVSFWAKTLVTGTYWGVFQMGTTTNGQKIILSFGRTDDSCYLGDRSTYGLSLGTYTSMGVNQMDWTHIVINYDSSTSILSLSLDSVHRGQIESFTPSSLIYSNTIKFSETYNSGTYWNGLLSNIRIYDRALPTQEIEDIYNYEKNLRPIAIDDGLVAYYPLKTNSQDNYYNQYNGTDYYNVNYDGTSAIFDGVNANINIPADMFSSLSPWSYSFWFKTNADDWKSSNEVIVDYGGSSVDTLLWLNSSGDIMQQSITGSQYTFSTVPVLGQWYYFVSTYDGTTIKNYIDNNLELSYNGTPVNSAGKYILLATNGGFSSAFNGSISNVRIYNKTLSSEEINVIYNTEKGEFI